MRDSEGWRSADDEMVHRLQLRRNLGNNPSLNALLQTYKGYYPDMIVGDIGAVKAGVFSVWPSYCV